MIAYSFYPQFRCHVFLQRNLASITRQPNRSQPAAACPRTKTGAVETQIPQRGPFNSQPSHSFPQRIQRHRHHHQQHRRHYHHHDHRTHHPIIIMVIIIAAAGGAIIMAIVVIMTIFLCLIAGVVGIVLALVAANRAVLLRTAPFPGGSYRVMGVGVIAYAIVFVAGSTLKEDIINMLDSERLAAIRRKLRLPQEQMARLLGVSFASVNRWEGGHSSPTGPIRDLYLALDAAIRAGNAPQTIVHAANNERGAFLYALFRMAYSRSRRSR